jgi:hypothetical protein
LGATAKSGLIANVKNRLCFKTGFSSTIRIAGFKKWGHGITAVASKEAR